MSSVSIFAFIDKEGIVTESQKYTDEIVLYDHNGKKQILDMRHDIQCKKEDQIYEFEEPKQY